MTTQLDNIINQITFRRRLFDNALTPELLPIVFIRENTRQDYSTVDLNGQFVQSQLLIDNLLRMPSSLSDKTELLSVLREHYVGNLRILSFLNEFEENYSSDRVVWWYTRESPLYRILNKALRVQNVELLFLFKFFIRDLHNYLERNRSSSPVRVYRAQLMLEDELQRLKSSIGKSIFMNSFLSTTLNREKAIFYFTESAPSNDLLQVLFDIDIDPQMRNVKSYANISAQSYFSDEEEVLTTLGSIYRVNNVEQESHIWIIQMSMDEDTNKDLHLIFEHMRLKYGDGPTDLLSFGAVLQGMGNFDAAEKYYHRLLTRSRNDDELTSICYHALGSIACEKGDYDSSLVWNQKSLDIRQRLPNIDNLAYNYINIGVAYQKKERYNKAIEFYEKAYQIWKHEYGENDPKVAIILNNIGGVYHAEENYSKALDCHQRAFYIWERHLPPNCFDLGASHNNIGCIFGCLGDYERATERFELALSIYQKSVPPEHPAVAKAFENMGLISFLQMDRQNALMYYEKAANVYGQSLPKSHPKISKIEQDIQCVLSGTMPSTFHFWWLDTLKLVNKKY